MFFAWAAVVNVVAKRVRATVRPWIVASHSSAVQALYDVVSNITTLSAFAYGSPFWTGLSYEKSALYLWNTRFFFFWGALLVYALTYLIPTLPPPHPTATATSIEPRSAIQKNKS